MSRKRISLHAFYDALDFDHEGSREIAKINTTMGGFGLAGTIRF